MTTLLFLDDRREPDQVIDLAMYSRILLARKAEDAMALVVEQPRFDVWSLDHDLAAGVQGRRLRRQVKTGFDFLVWALEHARGKMPGRILVHSANPWGRRRMLDLLSEARAQAVRRMLDLYPDDDCNA